MPKPRINTAILALSALILLTLGTSAVAGRSTIPAPVRGVVIACHDGDTCRVQTDAGATLTVRLLGIDTPEVSPAECGGQTAQQAIRAYLVGKHVVLQYDPAPGQHDRYRRELAYIVLPHGITMQRLLLRWGLAKVWEYRGEKLSVAAIWERQQQATTSRLRGTWRSCPAARAQVADYTHAWSTGPA